MVPGSFNGTGGSERFYEEEKHDDDIDAVPKLLVAIGSGVSMIKVEGEKFARVGGTMIGGGALLGLSNMLTGVNDFGRVI